MVERIIYDLLRILEAEIWSNQIPSKQYLSFMNAAFN